MRGAIRPGPVAGHLPPVATSIRLARRRRADAAAFGPCSEDGDLELLSSDKIGPDLGFPALIEALRAGHVAGVEAVERVLLTEPATPAPNHLLVWPAWRFGAFQGVKTVSVFPGNAAAGKPVNATVYLLFGGADGRPLACLTGDALTTMKTAADSALAAGFLARRDARVLAVLGAGAQGALAGGGRMRTIRPGLDRVVVWHARGARGGARRRGWQGRGSPPWRSPAPKSPSGRPRSSPA